MQAEFFLKTLDFLQAQALRGVSLGWCLGSDTSEFVQVDIKSALPYIASQPHHKHYIVCF